LLIHYLLNYVNNFLNLNSKTGITDIFIKDLPKNYAYNAIMVCEKNSKVMKIALIYSINNIVNNLYQSDPLSITGPGCLGYVVDYVYNKQYPYYYFNTVPISGLHNLSFVASSDINKKPIIKNTYYGYYGENEYGSTTHYDKLWHLGSVYKSDLSKKYSIKKMSDIKLFKSFSKPTVPLQNQY
jgi:hypothetical protein